MTTSALAPEVKEIRILLFFRKGAVKWDTMPLASSSGLMLSWPLVLRVIHASSKAGRLWRDVPDHWVSGKVLEIIQANPIKNQKTASLLSQVVTLLKAKQAVPSGDGSRPSS